VGVSLEKAKISSLANMLCLVRSGLTLKATLLTAAIFFAFMPTASQAYVYPATPSFGSGFSEPYPSPEWSLSALRGYIPVAPGKQGQGDHPLCASASDPHCANVHSILADLIIPPCYSDTDRICIEGLEIGAEGKPLEKAVLDHELTTKKTPADAKLGLPAGGSASIWNSPSVAHQGNALSYAVIVSAGYNIDKKATPNLQKFEAIRFEAKVIPVNIKKGSYCGNEIFEIEKDDYFGEVNTSSRMVGEGCKYPEYKECILTEKGSCAAPAEFLPNSRVALTLRMDSKVTGWLFGRMKEVDVAITSLDAKNNKLRVEATSVNLLSGTAWVAKKDLINYPDLYEYMKKRWFSGDGKFEDALNKTGSQWGDLMPTGTFDQFKVWEQLIKPNPEDNWRWNFASNTNSNTSGTNCFAQAGKDKLIGLVTTNAPIYDSGAPAFKDGALSYQVAGLHLKADGSLFKGSYDLAIRGDVARCLYGFSSSPIRASVSVLSSDGSTQDVATELVTEKNGWMTLSAKNFTFSQPTIKVKLMQDKPLSPTKTAGKEAAPVKKTVSKLKVINCVKGNMSKKVSGSNPKCPSGYKAK
jgi:hypothetical protein